MNVLFTMVDAFYSTRRGYILSASYYTLDDGDFFVVESGSCRMCPESGVFTEDKIKMDGEY